MVAVVQAQFHLASGVALRPARAGQAGFVGDLIGFRDATVLGAPARQAVENVGLMEFAAEDIVRRSMRIAADICVYTNTHLVLESL